MTSQVTLNQKKSVMSQIETLVEYLEIGENEHRKITMEHDNKNFQTVTSVVANIMTWYFLHPPEPQSQFTLKWDDRVSTVVWLVAGKRNISLNAGEHPTVFDALIFDLVAMAHKKTIAALYPFQEEFMRIVAVQEVSDMLVEKNIAKPASLAESFLAFIKGKKG